MKDFICERLNQLIQ